MKMTIERAKKLYEEDTRKVSSYWKKKLWDERFEKWWKEDLSKKHPASRKEECRRGWWEYWKSGGTK